MLFNKNFVYKKEKWPAGMLPPAIRNEKKIDLHSLFRVAKIWMKENHSNTKIHNTVLQAYTKELFRRYNNTL